MTILYMLCGIIIGHVTPVISPTATDDKNLHTKLFIFDDYKSRIRPIVNQTHAIEVYVAIHLKAINELDEVNEVLKTTGALLIHWRDEFLKWDPAIYGNLSYSFFPQDEVWKPDIALTNSYNDYKELGSKTLKVAVDYTGSVSWYPFQVYESTCSIDTRKFPFDVQTCSLTFVSWSYNVYEVSILGQDDGYLLSGYEPNAAWDIIGWSWSSDLVEMNSEISFSLTMKRKPNVLFVSAILPITLLSLLNIFVFVLPCESGERSGYAVTVFLALAVFLTIISTILPANSEQVAIFSIYLVIQSVQSTLTTLIAVLVLRLYSLPEETPIPSCITAVLRVKDKLTCKTKTRNNKIPDSGEENNSAENINDLVSVNSTQQNHIGNHDCEPTDEMLREYTLKQVINLLDIVCFIFFTVVFLISTMVCFLMSTGGDL